MTRDEVKDFYDHLVSGQARYFPCRSLEVFISQEAADLLPASRLLGFFYQSSPKVQIDPGLTGLDMRAVVRL